MLQTTDVSDVQISTSVSPARFIQDNADVLSLASEGWLLVWHDDRNGSAKIYWQVCDTLGIAAGANTEIAGSPIGNSFVDPLLASDTLGRVYLFYRDETAGLIFGRRYTSDLQLERPDFLINDTSGNAFAGPYDFAVFPDGQIVVVWEDYATAGSTIQMRLYSPSGVSTLGPVAVNSDGGDDQHWVPSVAVAPGSGFLVIWEDYRDDRADLYARQYTGAGSAVGSDFPLVAPPNDAYPQYAPTVTYSPKDRYVIGWEDLRQGQELYLQRYSQTSGLVGDNQRLTSGDTLISNLDLHLQTAPSGQVMTTWADFGVSNRILGLALDSGLAPVGQAVAKNTSGVGRRWAPSVAFAEGGKYAEVWTEFADNQPDLHLRLFASDDSPLSGDEIVVNDDAIGAVSHQPFIAATDRFRAMVCFTDQRRDPGDIFVRAITRVGDLSGLDHRVNQDSGPALQSEPASAANDSRSLIVWIDSRVVGGFSGQRIFGRFASVNGWFSDDEFMISDSAANSIKASPQAGMAGDGQTLVAWIDHRDGTAQVWGRWLASGGALDGAEFAISNSASDSAATDLNLSTDTSGRIFVTWLDIGLDSPAARTVWYNSDKSEGDRFSWVSTVVSIDINELAADVFPDGSLGLLWTGEALSRHRAYLTRLSTTGALLDGPDVISDDTLADAGGPVIGIDGNGYVLTSWEDWRSGKRAVYYQLMDPTLSPVGNNTAVSGASPEFMATPSVDAHFGWGWFAWADPRQDGLNIYASAINYDPTDVDDPGTILPTTFQLDQNYPNPFNPATVISFSLPEKSDVTLTVYNIQGQTVDVLIEGERPAGQHRIIWDGTDRTGARVASGVYLYRLTAGDQTESRKMMLLK